jgi:hypothetical protein
MKSQDFMKSVIWPTRSPAVGNAVFDLFNVRLSVSRIRRSSLMETGVVFASATEGKRASRVGALRAGIHTAVITVLGRRRSGCVIEVRMSADDVEIGPVGVLTVGNYLQPRGAAQEQYEQSEHAASHRVLPRYGCSERRVVRKNGRHSVIGTAHNRTVTGTRWRSRLVFGNWGDYRLTGYPACRGDLGAVLQSALEFGSFSAKSGLLRLI